MPDFDNPTHLQILEDVYNNGTSVYFKDLPITLTKAGKTQTGYYTVEYQPLRDTKGTVTGIVVTGIDITGYIISRQQLEASGQQV